MPADASVSSAEVLAAAAPAAACTHGAHAHEHEQQASTDMTPGCQHDAGARCSLCDLTTSSSQRDGDWTEIIGTLFRASPHDPAIFALALPAVLALAADPLLSMVDTIFVGQVRGFGGGVGVCGGVCVWGGEGGGGKGGGAAVASGC